MMFHPYPPAFGKYYCLFHGTVLWRIITRLLNVAFGASWLLVILSVAHSNVPVTLIGLYALGFYVWRSIQYDMWMTTGLQQYRADWSNGYLQTGHCVSCRGVEPPPRSPPGEPPTGTT